jgi:transcriptional regulator with XRE-family HTH domain
LYSGETYAASKKVQPKQVTAAEKQIGERIAAFRKMKGLSQGALGEAVGVTFQQVQKYEKGVNRASAGRLQQMAGVLGVLLTSFFDEVPGEEGPVEREVLVGLREPGAANLLRVYALIRSAELRRSVLQIAQELANAEARTGGTALADAATGGRKRTRLA